ncbi:hypothetical protein FA13DRAFT_1795185 [Coprinellus micaceus]|uniref:Uncharacterized protein n=1 Tax=Coprinellus micaceus TaxID=71717 RepID=A0A4Y7SYJ5_COPMI|nr:hypothetical protein FA13DRAFT_1795185 [Coprinellus micaceus]
MSVIPATVDHLKPRNWKGDTKVKAVVLQTPWRSGRVMAEEVLLGAAELFKRMEDELSLKPVDILLPNGSLLINVPLAGDNTEHDHEEEGGPVSSLTEPNGELAALDAEARVKVEDEAGILGEEENANGEASTSAFSRTVLVNGKEIVKSQALAAYSRHCTTASSTDRLK